MTTDAADKPSPDGSENFQAVLWASRIALALPVAFEVVGVVRLFVDSDLLLFLDLVIIVPIGLVIAGALTFLLSRTLRPANRKRLGYRYLVWDAVLAVVIVPVNLGVWLLWWSLPV